MGTRVLLHLNIDNFCAVVEQKLRTGLQNCAVIVGKPRGNTTGVVISASKEAKKCGVEEGMSVRQAQRTCPVAAVMQADYAAYRQVSVELLDILAQYSPLLEPDSLGSAYLDVTGSRNLFGDAKQISARISAEVRERLGLTVFVGCASNKLLAKAASGAGKSFALVAPGSESQFLSPMPVGMLNLINTKIAKRLGELGVSTVGQLAAIPEALLVRQFGTIGSAIMRQCRGFDSSQVKAAYPVEIIISEHRFDASLLEPAEVEANLRVMVDEALGKLRKRGGLAGEVVLEMMDEEQVGKLESQKAKKLETSICASGHLPAKHSCDGLTSGPSTIDSRLQTPDPRLSLLFHFKKPTDSAFSINQILGKLLASKMRPGMEISWARIILSELTPGCSSQLCLIGDAERGQRLDRATEIIRERFGEKSVCPASALASTVLSRFAA